MEHLQRWGVWWLFSRVAHATSNVSRSASVRSSPVAATFCSG
ncbi:hypothetical protein MBEHAL_1047 [Halarchaeum acidiphilum MH1-52-1]|uniref:Uncharacterized protein n=1 Tax=Halarchaeum acidiphilum MH1-52-1 TaxID=1261545 RepID=U2YU71_9EURY|nr:hypothetical protein MBEHAL_1047 [Halarchaeum acidiphilum MH1-52-1]